MKGHYTRQCRTPWSEINKGNDSPKYQKYRSPPQDGQKQQRQKIQQKEPFTTQYFKGNENYDQKNNKQQQTQTDQSTQGKGNQVIQITIQKINLPLLVIGLTYNHDQWVQTSLHNFTYSLKDK